MDLKKFKTLSQNPKVFRNLNICNVAVEYIQVRFSNPNWNIIKKVRAEHNFLFLFYHS